MGSTTMTNKALMDVIESAIVDDLHNASLTYITICFRRHVGMNKVVEIAKKHNLTRKRGRVSGRKLYRPVATK